LDLNLFFEEKGACIGILIPFAIQTATTLLQVHLPTEAAKAEDGPSHLALWTSTSSGIGIATACVFLGRAVGT